MRALTLLLTATILFAMLPQPSSAQTYIEAEPQNLFVDLVQGQDATVSFTIKNEFSYTVNGVLEVLNLECGYKCPGARLSVSNFSLGPGESLVVVVFVDSGFLNERQTVSLPIVVHDDHFTSQATIANVHITVHLNTPVYIGIPGILALVLIVIYLGRLKKELRSEREKGKEEG